MIKEKNAVKPLHAAMILFRLDLLCPSSYKRRAKKKRRVSTHQRRITMFMNKLRKPMIALSIAVYLCCLMATPAVAGMMGAIASDSDAVKTRAEELTRVQRTLEMEIVKGQLAAYGLTPEEVNQRLEGLSDEQLHMLAQASDRVLAGGDGGEVIIAVLLIILIVLLILYLTNKQIVVK
jgi:hypothetical protein